MDGADCLADLGEHVGLGDDSECTVINSTNGHDHNDSDLKRHDDCGRAQGSTDVTEQRVILIHTLVQFMYTFHQMLNNWTFALWYERRYN